MTPAVEVLKQAQIVFSLHEYQHDQTQQSYGLEAAEKLAVAAEQVFKTLVVSLDKQRLAVAIIPVQQQLSLKAMAKACQAKKAAMADKALVQKTTGYVLGGVSPLGQKKRLATMIDITAQSFAHIYISGGRRGLEIQLAAEDLKQSLNGKFVSLCQ